MSTSVTKSTPILAALMTAAVLLGSYASGANAALRVNNGLEDGNLTVLHPPGCCSSCIPAPGKSCPEVCEVCANVVVESRKEVTLGSRVGPYPLEYLQIQVQGEVYCVPDTDLKHLTSTAQLSVGPGGCGELAFPNSISATILDEKVPGPPDSGRFITCLQLCGEDLDSQ